MHPQTLQINNHPTSTVGETLLRLHYLDQIPAAGRLLAGFVSLFFIFAVVTGVLIHLKNIFTKFWAFSFKGALKQMWTNTHTVLGILGLPYQLMYAITGAFYLLLFLVLLPAVMFIFDGKIEKVYSLAYPSYGITYSDSAKVADNTANFVRITEQVTQQYPQFKLSAIQLHHYNKEDGAVSYLFTSKDAGMFFSEGFIGYRLKDGQELFNTLPGEKLFTIK
jgi:hypothetical protein